MEANARARLRDAEKAWNAADAALDEVLLMKSGDVPMPDQAKAMKKPVSYGVHFTRNRVLRQVRSPGLVCKSVRRFSSMKEAVQHGKRFMKKHNHASYKIVKVAKRPNAWINWRTGKTNPVL
jgi:hypothetical protein